MLLSADWSALKTYDPRFNNSYLASISSALPSVSPRTMFSITTTSLGWLTAKYGSAVTIMPNDLEFCRDIQFPAVLRIKQDFTEVLRATFRRNCPQTYVRYSGPYFCAGFISSNSTSTSI